MCTKRKKENKKKRNKQKENIKYIFFIQDDRKVWQTGSFTLYF